MFPWRNRKTGELVAAETFLPPENCVHLYRHFLATGKIQGIPYGKPSLLAHTGRDVCRMIHEGDERWRQLVPQHAWAMAERHAGKHQPGHGDAETTPQA